VVDSNLLQEHSVNQSFRRVNDEDEEDDEDEDEDGEGPISGISQQIPETRLSINGRSKYISRNTAAECTKCF